MAIKCLWILLERSLRNPLRRVNSFPKMGKEVLSEDIKDGEIVNADVAAAAAIAYSKLATDPRIARIKNGTYTGDGTTSQAITGVGFQAILLIIQTHDTIDTTAAYTQTKMANMPTDGTLYTSAILHGFYTNMIKSIDADGFTVSDYGADLSPNKNGQVHDYIAFG